MCIIAAKPKGVDIPEYNYISNMLENNPDGAGLMYARKGKVFIEKGFMTKEAFMNRLDELDQLYNLKHLSMVMHFRITTHGGTKPENCHPFPVTDSIAKMKKLNQAADLGVAHNGIINITTPKDISDTMQYIASQMAPLKRAVPQFYKDKNLMEMVNNAIESKMVILDGKGNLYYIGNFSEEKGIKYSNTTYMYSRHDYRSYHYSWNMYDDNYETDRYDGWWIYRDLMWLDYNNGEYVVMPDGEIDVGVNDYAIDRYGNVYVMDTGMDTFVKLPSAKAYDSHDNRLEYNKDSLLVSKEYVMME